MSYRIREPRRHQHRRDVRDVATPSGVYVQNGATFNYAIPCWYLIAEEPRRAHCHSRAHHDHVGWPSPNHPDHICQHWDFAHSCCSHEHGKHVCDHCSRFLDMGLLRPIHLSKEGYDKITVAFDSAPEGLKATGSIDEKRDWIVRIQLSANVRAAVKEKVLVPYAVFAEGTVSGRKTRDVVARGVMVIVPGPLPGGTIDIEQGGSGDGSTTIRP